MEETKALTLQDTISLGKVLAESGFFADVKGTSQAIVKILAGQELGFPPLASMTSIYIVKGKVTLSANLMATAIKRGGKYNYLIKRLDDTGCVLAFTENGKAIGESSFTEADAKKAALLEGDNWKKYPRNMYFARALSNGAKWYCPDAFGMPVYSPDEMDMNVNVETGEIIEGEAKVVESPKPQTRQPEQAQARPKPVSEKPAPTTTDDPLYDRMVEVLVGLGESGNLETMINELARQRCRGDWVMLSRNQKAALLAEREKALSAFLDAEAGKNQ